MNRKRAFLNQNAGRAANRSGMTRRDFMTRMLAGGLGLAGVSSAFALPNGRLASFQGTRPLTPTFYQWIEDFHSNGIFHVNESFPGLNYQIAPVEGFGIERFVAEARNNESTWDVYVGMTPFVEMTQLIEADVIEPWDNYIPQEVLDDLLPKVREECSVDGKLYNWPFLLDVNIMAWNSELTDAAGITNVPANWDEYLANAQQVIDSGAALYGATYDSHGWRSLAPMTHSLSTDVYTPEGLFDFTNDAVVEALKLMKQIAALSSPDLLLEGTSDGGVSGTPDEVAFAARRVAYYTKFQNAPLRMAANWPDPSLLRLAPLPAFVGGEGSTVFWTTGATLFKNGQNKEQAAEYIRALTYDPVVWQGSIEGTDTAHPGQLPPYMSIYDEWAANPPAWMPDFVPLVRGQLDVAKAIENHLFGLSQFLIGKPHWETYITGEVDDPLVALQAAKDAVLAEMANT
jgi:multiple sugar transport system substrate-binding protein